LYQGDKLQSSVEVAATSVFHLLFPFLILHTKMVGKDTTPYQQVHLPANLPT
jgi:hypothetical protein